MKAPTAREYSERYIEMPTSATRSTPREDVEAAILAEGHYLDENPVKAHTWASENADDYKRQYDDAQSRVLSRERTLILRRV